MNTTSKKCPMCAEEILLAAMTCEYCGAQFQVTSTGYCQKCHEVREADENSQCKVCGNKVVDLRVESRFIEEQIQEPIPLSLPVSQPEISETRKSRLPVGILTGILVLAVVGAVLWFGRNSLFATPVPTVTSTSLPMLTSTVTLTSTPVATVTPDPVPVNRSLWSGSPHADANAWAFSNWNDQSPPVVPETCARCHSQTGNKDYLGLDGSPKEVVDSLPPSGKALDCETCHADTERYNLFNLDNVLFPSGVRLSFAPGDPNNQCVTCHQGRSSRITLDKYTGDDAPNTLYDNKNFQNPHYTMAGATLFGSAAEGAYQYNGKMYEGRNLHVEGFDTCIGCHDPHSTAVRIGVCVTCHTGSLNSSADLRQIRSSSGQPVDYDGDGNIQEGVYGEIDTLNQTLYRSIQLYSQQRLGKSIVYRLDIYPYFFIDSNGNGLADDGEALTDNRLNSWTPRLLRATYNYQWSIKEPGAYAHNPRYMIQILYDTLQDLGVDISTLSRP